MDKFIVGVIGKDLFPSRMHIEKELGHFLYDQLIAILELIGEEVESNEISHLRLGIYLDTKNEGARKFALNEKEANIVFKYLGHKFYDELKKYSSKEQKKGTELLFQLNEGKISASDFANRF